MSLTGKQFIDHCFTNYKSFYIMNQQTLQKIYKIYQTQEYFHRYFHQLKLREDSRQFSQSRDIKICIRQNTIAISKGQTIVICQLSSQVQKVIYNSVEKCYGRQLFNINVKFSSAKGVSIRQNRPSSSVGQFINKKISWPQIEDQLVFKQTGNRFYAHTGDIQVRVVSNDGSLNQVCLLAVQLLLWTFKFNRIDPETGQTKNEQYLLQIPYFYYPSKYCEIMDQLLIDPTLSEQQNSSYLVSIIGDLLSNKIEQNYTLIQKLGKNCEKIPQQIIESILSMWKVQMSKLTFDVKELRMRINSSQNKEDSIDLLICQ